jgi:DNA-binding YbaB/EbfC family protein
MMQQAQSLQNKIGEMQKKLESEESEGTSGGGMVKVVLSGKHECKRLTIDPKLIDPNDKEMLEDLIIAAFNDARAKVETNYTEQMSKVAGSMGLPAGMKLPF